MEGTVSDDVSMNDVSAAAADSDIKDLFVGLIPSLFAENTAEQDCKVISDLKTAVDKSMELRLGYKRCPKFIIHAGVDKQVATLVGKYAMCDTCGPHCSSIVEDGMAILCNVIAQSEDDCDGFNCNHTVYNTVRQTTAETSRLDIFSRGLDYMMKFWEQGHSHLSTIDDALTNRCVSVVGTADTSYVTDIIDFCMRAVDYELINDSNMSKILHATVQTLDRTELDSVENVCIILSSIGSILGHQQTNVHGEFLKAGYWEYVVRYLNHHDGKVKKSSFISLL